MTLHPSHRPRLRTANAFARLAVVVLTGCGGASGSPRLASGVTAPSSMTVTSTAFTEGKLIPVDHTCDGKDSMPALILSSPPEGTKSLVVIMEDVDTAAPFTHLVAFDLSPDVRRVGGGDALSDAGDGARFGQNDFMAVRYSGPCPPRGDLHRYLFRVIAVDKVLGLPEGAPRERVERAIDGHVLGGGTLTAQFGH